MLNTFTVCCLEGYFTGAFGYEGKAYAFIA
jgi:hypothetical protein